MNDVFIGTHELVTKLSHDGTFTAAQAERLKEVLQSEMKVVSETDLDAALAKQTNQFLLAMFTQTALVLAGVQFIVSLSI